MAEEVAQVPGNINLGSSEKSDGSLFWKKILLPYQMKSVQWQQKTGCLKNLLIKLWFMTLRIVFLLIAPALVIVNMPSDDDEEDATSEAYLSDAGHNEAATIVWHIRFWSLRTALLLGVPGSKREFDSRPLLQSGDAWSSPSIWEEDLGCRPRSLSAWRSSSGISVRYKEKALNYERYEEIPPVVTVPWWRHDLSSYRHTILWWGGTRRT